MFGIKELKKRLKILEKHLYKPSPVTVVKEDYLYDRGKGNSYISRYIRIKEGFNNEGYYVQEVNDVSYDDFKALSKGLEVRKKHDPEA